MAAAEVPVGLLKRREVQRDQLLPVAPVAVTLCFLPSHLLAQRQQHVFTFIPSLKDG
jgi:hypothetical protein